ncbi:BOB1 [Symbiodinium pilosum]|uniref:BOB1 protein n=1 Tax=Symbiodinium pilosum TaxID=2952 RepID=A0A812X7S1_SYMPI|nr:BOB1 [Symbiodinium pilosum]
MEAWIKMRSSQSLILQLVVISTPKGGRASDIDFASLICGAKMADVCEDEELDGERDEEEEL